MEHQEFVLNEAISTCQQLIDARTKLPEKGWSYWWARLFRRAEIEAVVKEALEVDRKASQYLEHMNMTESRRSQMLSAWQRLDDLLLKRYKWTKARF